MAKPADMVGEHPLSPTLDIIDDPLNGHSLQPDSLLAGIGDRLTLFGSDEAASVTSAPAKSAPVASNSDSRMNDASEPSDGDLSGMGDRVIIHLSRAPHQMPIAALRTEYEAISGDDTAALVTQELSRRLVDLQRRFDEHQRQARAREDALINLLRDISGTQVSAATIERTLLRAQAARPDLVGEITSQDRSGWPCEIALSGQVLQRRADPLQTNLEDAMSDFSSTFEQRGVDGTVPVPIPAVDIVGLRKPNHRTSNSLTARMLGGSRNATRKSSHTDEPLPALGGSAAPTNLDSDRRGSHSRPPSVRSSNSVTSSHSKAPKGMTGWATNLLGRRSTNNARLAVMSDEESSESSHDVSEPVAVVKSASMSPESASLIGGPSTTGSDLQRQTSKASSTNLSGLSHNTTAASSVSPSMPVSKRREFGNVGVESNSAIVASTATSVAPSTSPVTMLVGRKASPGRHADFTVSSTQADNNVSGAFVSTSGRITASSALSALKIPRADTAGHKTSQAPPTPSHFRAVSESASHFEEDMAASVEQRLFAMPTRVSLNIARWTERLLVNTRQIATPASLAPLDTQMAASTSLARSDSLSPISRAMSPRVSQSAGKGLPVSASVSTQDASISSFSLSQEHQGDVPEHTDGALKPNTQKQHSKGYLSSARGTIGRAFGFGNPTSTLLRPDQAADAHMQHDDVFTAGIFHERAVKSSRHKMTASVSSLLPNPDKALGEPQRNVALKALVVELGTITPSAAKPPTMTTASIKRSAEDPLIDRFGFVYDLKAGMKLLREQRLRDKADARPMLNLDATNAVVDEAGLKEALGPSPLATPHLESALKLPEGDAELLNKADVPVNDATHNASIRKLLSNLVEMDDNVEKCQRDAWDAFIKQRQVKLNKSTSAKREKLALSASQRPATQATSGPAGLAITAEDADFLDGGLVGVATMGRGKEDDKLFRKLIRGGVPVSYRPAIWVEISGANDLREPGMYHDLLAKHADQETPCLDQIDMDTHRTFPTNVFFAGSGPGVAKLRRVLIAYSWRDPIIGYCQGMNVLAALLLLVFPEEEEAFWMLASLLERVLPSDYYSPSLLVSQADQRVLRDLLRIYLPEVYTHLDEMGVDTPAVTFGWFLSLFADALPVQTLLRVWDALLVYGPVVLFRVAVALFKIYATEILAAESASAFYVLISSLTAHTFNADKLLKVAFDDLRDIKRQAVERSRLKHVGELELELAPRLSPAK